MRCVIIFILIFNTSFSQNKGGENCETSARRIKGQRITLTDTSHLYSTRKTQVVYYGVNDDSVSGEVFRFSTSILSALFKKGYFNGDLIQKQMDLLFKQAAYDYYTYSHKKKFRVCLIEVAEDELEEYDFQHKENLMLFKLYVSEDLTKDFDGRVFHLILSGNLKKYTNVLDFIKNSTFVCFRYAYLEI